MKFLNRSKFFNYYLPLTMTAIVLIVSAGIYLSLKKPAQPAEAAWYSSSWTYRKPITIDHTKLSTTATSTFSSFALLVSVTDSDLKSTGNGGKQASSTGVDILFTDSNGTTKLDHEVESYASTTGQLIAWVRIPTLTSSADYTIYIYFGNSGASDQSNATGVWDTNYKGVWHLPNGTTLGLNDSTVNVQTGTNHGATPTAGQIGGAAAFSSGSSQYIDNGTITGISGATAATLSGWMYRSAASNFVSFGQSTSNYRFNLEWYNDGNLYLQAENGGQAFPNIVPPQTTGWHYVVFVFDGSQSGYARDKGYWDGVSQTVLPGFSPQPPASLASGANQSPFWVGRGGVYSTGIIDEVRVSNTIRSADWIATEYNNQSSPSTFYAYGALGIQQSSPSTNVGGAGSAWYNASWLYRKSITIDHTKLSTTATSTFSNYPLLFSVTDSDLKSTGNGGKQASSTGVDILFTDSNGTTKLDHEVETYASTTGQLIAWVRIPTLTSSSDYPIYIYFGNANASDQSNKTGVWDSNYKGVWHLSDNAANTTVVDSTATSNGTNAANTSGKSTSAQIANGLTYNGSSDYTDLGSSAPYSLTNNFSIEAWVKGTTFSGNAGIIAKINSGGSVPGYGIVTNGGKLNFYDNNAGYLAQDNTPSTGVWHQVVAVLNAGTKYLYFDGVQQSTTQSASPSTNANDLFLGTFYSNLPTNLPFTGSIDEARFSNSARSSDWIKTQYNNQSSPSTFYAYGALGVQNRSGAGVAVASRGAGSAWYNASWLYRKSITIDHTKLSTTATSTFSNYPLLFSVTDSDLKSTGNGGKQASSTGVDILFTDSNGTTKLDHEVETYASTTGQLIAWVRIPTLTSSSDYPIYIYFGNANASDQSNKTGVWDSNYKLVAHFANGTTLSASDSTSNNTSGAVSVATAAAGQIDGAMSVTGGSNITYTDKASLHVDGGDFTASTWFFLNSQGAYSTLFDKGSGGTRDLAFFINSATDGFYGVGGNGNTWTGGSGWTTGRWHYMTWTRSGSANTVYLDGGSPNFTFTNAGNTDNSFNLGVGNNPSGGGTSWNGLEDEFRLSNIARSADWIATEYANQNSPSTFYRYGGTLQANSRKDSSGNPAPAVKVRGGVRFH